MPELDISLPAWSSPETRALARRVGALVSAAEKTHQRMEVTDLLRTLHHAMLAEALEHVVERWAGVEPAGE